MQLLGLFAGIVFAAESLVISPLPNDWQPPEPPVVRAQISFGELSSLISEAEVLGEQVEITPTPTPVRTTRQKSYTIAVLGDSMVDTLGPEIPNLYDRLRQLYPLTNFNILNYGVGGTNINYGLERVTRDYNYEGRQVPSLVSQKPEVVVIESFGYNPFPNVTDGLTKQWLSLAAIVDALRAHLPEAKIVIAATIAPNALVFGDGALNWGPEGKQQKVTEIKSYLENAVKFAASQHLPLADSYHASLGSDGNGKLAYINPGDHLHYSDAGRALFAQKVAEAIVNNKLLE